MHKSVLLQEVLEGLHPQSGETILDGTINGGGHSESFCDAVGSTGTLIGLDMDKSALRRAEDRLKGRVGRLILENENFRNLDRVLQKHAVPHLDKVLFDLGWSSNQLDGGRGLSFQKDEPLIMTYKEEPDEDDLTARTIVNEWDEENIATIIFHYGEERYSRRIAKSIVRAREMHPIETTRELVDIIESAVPGSYRHGRIHPATRTFQALRITVNDELGALRQGIQKGFDALEAGGRLAIISFHSIEDRIVKNEFRDLEAGERGKIIYKKPLVASPEEIAQNPRARSAKLRIIERQ